MAFILEPFENITFEIPDGKGKTVELSVPPLDCFAPGDVEKMNKKLAEVPEDTPDNLNPNKDGTALVRHLLAYYNPSKAQRDAIAQLVPRHLQQIDKHWGEASKNLGESEPSIGGSSETTDQE